MEVARAAGKSDESTQLSAFGSPGVQVMITDYPVYIPKRGVFILVEALYKF